ncbi:YLP motif-containing protein 1-like protein, partial [Leptotrombidium deliense]
MEIIESNTFSKDADDRLENDYNLFIQETTEFAKKLEEEKKAALDTDDRKEQIVSNTFAQMPVALQSAITSVEVTRELSPIKEFLDNDMLNEAKKTLRFLQKKYTLLNVINTLDELHRQESGYKDSYPLESSNTSKCENMTLSSDNEDDAEVKAMSDDIMVPGSKPFDLGDAISKMKAIKPPENSTLLQTPPVATALCQKPLFPSTVQQISSTPQNYFQKSVSSASSDPLIQDESRPTKLPDESLADFKHREELFRKSSAGYIAKTIDYGHKVTTGNEAHVKNSPVRHSRNTSELNSLYSRPQYKNFSFEKMSISQVMREVHSERVIPNEPKVLTYKDTRYFTDPPSGVVSIDDLLSPPSRDFRPKNIVIILRGLPGSGKTYFAKLVKDKEVENGGSAPRILSLDDYFLVEKDNSNQDEDIRKGIVAKGLQYEYDREMEQTYRVMLSKTFRKTVDNGYFSIIIIDAINELTANYEELYNYAIKR